MSERFEFITQYPGNGEEFLKAMQELRSESGLTWRSSSGEKLHFMESHFNEEPMRSFWWVSSLDSAAPMRSAIIRTWVMDEEKVLLEFIDMVDFLGNEQPVEPIGSSFQEFAMEIVDRMVAHAELTTSTSDESGIGGLVVDESTKQPPGQAAATSRRANLDNWFDRYHQRKKDGLSAYLWEVAERSGYSLSYVKALHSEYKKRNGLE